MALRMVALDRAADGRWFARKGIPKDVRDDYAQLYGVRHEAQLKLPGDTPRAQARLQLPAHSWRAEDGGTPSRSQTSLGAHSEGKLSRWRRARCRREGPTRTPQRDTPVLVSILTELSGPTGLEFSRPAAVSIAR
jgi:hypothetical protein